MTDLLCLHKKKLRKLAGTMASVHKFPAVKTGRQGEFGAGSWRGSKQLQGLASKGGTEENEGTAEVEH
jgi:hypothetical protein